MKKNAMILAAGFAIAFGSTGALAQDWPQWRGPNRDGKAAAFSAPQTWPAQLTQKWKVNAGSGDSSPALAGGKLYVFGRQDADESILCLDAASGKELWKENYPAPAVAGPASSHPGPRSTPAVAEGKVVAMGVSGILSCLDASTGKKLWRKDDFPGAFPRFYTAMSPLIVDGLCIAHLGAQNNGALVAYDLASGDQKWKWTAEGPAYASPVLMTLDGVKTIVTLADKSLVGVSAADGKTLFQIPFPAQGRAYNAATPIAEGQTLYFAGQDRGSKAVKIAKEGDGYVAKELWTNKEMGVQFNSPILKGGLIFGLSQGGKFFCLNAENGQTSWTDPAGQRGQYGSLVDAGSVVLALTPKSQLAVFQPSDKEYKELASYKVAEKQTYAYPVVAGNRIYIRDQDSITLWTIE
jgi:outer membrane protein assembly factor BamB